MHFNLILIWIKFGAVSTNKFFLIIYGNEE